MQLPFFSRKPVPDDPDDYRLTLIEHIDELRNRLVRSLVSIVIGWVVGWQLIDKLYGPTNDRILAAVNAGTQGKVKVSEAFRNAPDAFLLTIKLSFWIGVVLVFPYIFLQIWGFIAPGLKLSERKALNKVAPWSVVLFIMGAGFALLVTPSAIAWFADFIRMYSHTDLIQEPGTMVFFILKMLLAFGIAFQLPLVVYVLGELELLQASTLLKYWRHSATAIFIIAMIITPSNDPASMLMMAIPLCILFIISVYVVKLSQAKKRRSNVLAPDENEFTPPSGGVE